MNRPSILIFPSELGWIAVVVAKTMIKQLIFGHATAAAAKAALEPEWAARAIPGSVKSPLVKRLQGYASGTADDFQDVQVDLGTYSKFQRRVLTLCRRVGYGSTISYAALAMKAGSPGAARAVGNCMAANRVPLIIPCHRVVCASGQMGSYSAPGGARTKRRLLRLEAKNWARIE